MQWFHERSQQIKKYRLVCPFAANHRFASRGGSRRGKRDDSRNVIASTVGVLYMESYIPRERALYPLVGNIHFSAVVEQSPGIVDEPPDCIMAFVCREHGHRPVLQRPRHGEFHKVPIVHSNRRERENIVQFTEDSRGFPIVEEIVRLLETTYLAVPIPRPRGFAIWDRLRTATRSHHCSLVGAEAEAAERLIRWEVLSANRICSSGPTSSNCFSFGILESILCRSRDVLVALDVEVGSSIPRSLLGAGRPPWGAAEEGKIQVRSESIEAGAFTTIRSDGSALMAGSD
ncbi:hypothetical protein DFH08DRAFT_827891 [Mycena albidolilacea]|uniref:Uncharacterized protein n=1 Tax=Mycena albidolilacea TaxID=1033008 RepID=A0AAD6YX76_9AGAR|nr:hypothetical protein DFH08DRAFT_827891 [Mycena albidolilacea]